MKPNDKRKITNRKESINTAVIITIIIMVLYYFGININFLIVGLLIFFIGVHTYFMLDYNDDIADIKDEIIELKNNK